MRYWREYGSRRVCDIEVERTRDRFEARLSRPFLVTDRTDSCKSYHLPSGTRLRTAQTQKLCYSVVVSCPHSSFDLSAC